MAILTILGLLFVLLVSWMIWSKMTWKTFMIGTDIRSEEAIRDRYKTFKANKIRCRLKRETQTPVVTGISPMVNHPVHPEGPQDMLKLMVHRRDIYKVNQLEL